MLEPQALKFCTYLSFKLDCMAEQEANPLTIDLVKAKALRDELTALKKDKVTQLAKAMPKNPQDVQRPKPKVLYKKDGSLSAAGERWFALLKKLKLPETVEGPVKETVGYEDGNPNSTPQVKDWLFSLGWKPKTYKYVKDKATGDERMIEQVRKDGELCDSVKALVDKDPAIEILDGLTVLTHRLGVINGLITHAKVTEWVAVTHGSDDPNMIGCGAYGKTGKVAASAGGFTNTLRFKHREPVVNLPGVERPWGAEIRGCIVAPEDQGLIGADVSSLESCTKRHYMWPHDPEYVQEMSQPGFDEHLDLAKFAGAITQEDIDEYNINPTPELKSVRKKYKPANYAGIYGIGPPKLARELGSSVKEAKALLKAYWERNWAVKKVASEQYVKTLDDGSMWLYNPVSGYYYSLRYEKDIFSTLNQGTGVFVFDLWVMFMRKAGVKISGQMHDEVITTCPEKEVDNTKEVCYNSMSKVNEALGLNVTIGIDAKVGQSYSEVH